MPRISLSDGFDRSRRAHWSLDPSVSALALEFALAANLNQGELAGRLDHRALAAAAVQSLVDRLIVWSASRETPEEMEMAGPLAPFRLNHSLAELGPRT